MKSFVANKHDLLQKMHYMQQLAKITLCATIGTNCAIRHHWQKMHNMQQLDKSALYATIGELHYMQQLAKIALYA